MARKNRKILLHRQPDVGSGVRYPVVETTNTRVRDVGERLTTKQVDDLHTDSTVDTVVIRPAK